MRPPPKSFTSSLAPSSPTTNRQPRIALGEFQTLGLVRAAGNPLTLVWPSVPGALYRVQYKEDLAATAWTNLGNDLTGTSAPLSVSPDTTAAHKRFYHLLVV